MPKNKIFFLITAFILSGFHQNILAGSLLAPPGSNVIIDKEISSFLGEEYSDILLSVENQDEQLKMIKRIRILIKPRDHSSTL